VNAKEVITKMVTTLEDSEEPVIEKSVNREKKKFLGNIKRKYRIMLIFVFFLLLIIIFMVMPMVIAILFQNSI
jgi:t-SNARE complex subunit (syntaxin)